MKVYELLDSSEKWIKYDLARDKHGRALSLYDDRAVCWCLAAAIVKCYADDNDDFFKGSIKYMPVYQKVMDYHNGKYLNVSEWNDNSDTTYDDIIRVCKALNV